MVFAKLTSRANRKTYNARKRGRGRPRTIPPTSEYKIKTLLENTPIIYIKSNLNLTTRSIKIKLQNILQEKYKLDISIPLTQCRLFNGHKLLKDDNIVFRTKKTLRLDISKILLDKIEAIECVDNIFFFYYNSCYR